VNFTIRIALVFALVVPLWSQAPTDATVSIPPNAGIYYRSPSGWVLFRAQFLFPFSVGGFRDLVSSHRRGKVEIPGPTAEFRITEPRPTFSVRGLSPRTGLYLVRTQQEQDYREVRVSIPRDVYRWAGFRRGDLTDLDVESVSTDTVRVRPRADLSPGEYVLVSDFASQYRAFHVAAPFSVSK